MGIQEILSEESAKLLPADYTGRATDVNVKAGKALRAALDATEELGRIDPRFEGSERDKIRNGIIGRTTKALDAHLVAIRGAVAAMRADRETYFSRDAFLRRATFDRDAAKHAAIATDWRARLASVPARALEAHARDAVRNNDRALAQVLLELNAGRHDELPREVREKVQELVNQIPIVESDTASRLLLEAEQLSEDVVEAGRLLRGGRPNGSYAIRRGLRQHAATNQGAALEQWFKNRREQREHAQGAAW